MGIKLGFPACRMKTTELDFDGSSAGAESSYRVSFQNFLESGYEKCVTISSVERDCIEI